MGTKEPALAKISRPAVKNLYKRKRLFQQLNEGLDRSVLWVSSQGGSGKTSLISSYVHEKKLPCLWYQVDQGDGNIASFFYYMSQAGKKAAPRRRKPLPILTPEQMKNLPVFSREYFRELYSRIKSPGVIVLDNYQDAPSGSELHTVLQHGLNEVPEGLTMIVISREDPPAELARIRASTSFSYIGWDDLRLTETESRGIYRHFTKKELANDCLESLYRVSDGWIAGMVLLAEKVSENMCIEELRDEMSRTVIFDYFAGEVFRQIDKKHQDFLLKTAYLPKIRPELADKLTGRSDSDSTLKNMVKRNFFTVRRPGREPSYEYHPLFREFLTLKSEEVMEEKELSAITAKASGLLEDAGNIDEAAELHINTHNWKSLTKLILANAPAIFSQVRFSTLQQWIEAIPRSILAKEPWLIYWLGISRIQFDPRESQPHFERAFELFRKNKEPEGIFLSWAGIVESILYDFNDLSRHDKWIAIMDRLVKEYPAFPSEETELRAASSMFAILILRQPGHPDILKWGERANELFEKHKKSIVFVNPVVFMIRYQITIGDFRKGGVLLRSIPDRSKLPAMAQLILGKFEADYHIGNLSADKSIKTALSGLELGTTSGIHILDCMHQGIAVMGYLFRNDFNNSRKLLEEMALSAEKGNLYDRYFYYFVKAWDHLRNDELDDARHNMSLALDDSIKFGEPLAVANSRLGMVHILNKMGGHENISDYMEDVRRVVDETDCRQLRMLYLYTKAYLDLQQRTDTAARTGLEALQRLLQIGRGQSVIPYYHWQPDVMAYLCQKALENGIEKEYVRELITKCRIVPARPPVHLENWPWPVRIYSLGRFHIQINGEDLKFTKKPQKTPLNMLKAIIALGGTEVSRDGLTDILWPDADGDSAVRSFNTNMHRLRNLLGNENAVRVEGGRITLDRKYCWVDAWAFAHISLTAELRWNKDRTISSYKTVLEMTDKADSLYKGHFLQDDEETWAAMMRDRLRERKISNVNMLCDYWKETGMHEDAVQCLNTAIDKDSLVEAFYQCLMHHYKKLGRNAESLAVYERCKKTFNTILGIEPSEKTKAIYLSIRQPEGRLC